MTINDIRLLTLTYRKEKNLKRIKSKNYGQVFCIYNQS